MARRKQQLSAEEFRLLIREHGIRFRGPAPPKEWPEPYQHHFHAIRDIGTVRYDDYKADRTVGKKRLKYLKNRVASIRETAYNFLDDLNMNEPTWRDLEPLILERFKNRVIW